MKTISEFMQGIVDYFGTFQNETVQEFFTDELARVKPADYDRLFRNIITHYPATWHPDVKALNDSVNALHLNMLEPVSNIKCPVCGGIGTIKVGVCIVCQYAPATDGDPKEYQEWWKRRMLGKEPQFNISDLYKIGQRIKIEKEKEQ